MSKEKFGLALAAALNTAACSPALTQSRADQLATTHQTTPNEQHPKLTMPLAEQIPTVEPPPIGEITPPSTVRHDIAPQSLPLEQAKTELKYWQHLSEISKSPVKLQRHQAKLAEKLARKKAGLTKARNLEHPKKLNEEILNLEKQVTDSKLAPDLIETFLHIAEANKIYSEYKTKKHP